MFVLYSFDYSDGNDYETFELIMCSLDLSHLEVIKAAKEKIAHDTNVALNSYHRKLYVLTETNPYDQHNSVGLTELERVQRYSDWIKPLQQTSFDQTIEEHGTHLLEMYPNVDALENATPLYKSFTIEEVDEV